jgi:uncharacterized protein (DUF433 family)
MTTVLENHINVNPEIRREKPRINGTRITVDDIVVMHLRMGQSLAEIAGKYDLSLAAVHAAMAFYYDHKAEIDERITQDEAYAEAFERNNPSLLKEKLRTLRSE